MSNFINTLVNTLNGYLWGPIMIVLCLGVAIIYSVVLKFPQIRLFKSMVHYLTKGSSSENGISSFQGFAMALGGRVGVGNIAGVATAIFYGGPGALFWMWIYALLGAASAFAESTAGQIWKTEDNGEYCGGPAQYIARGLRCKPLAVLYALAAVLAFGLTGPTVQSYNIADSMRNAFNVPPLVTGIIVAILFAVIVAGGAKHDVAALKGLGASFLNHNPLAAELNGLARGACTCQQLELANRKLLLVEALEHLGAHGSRRAQNSNRVLFHASPFKGFGFCPHAEQADYCCQCIQERGGHETRPVETKPKRNAPP